MMCLNGTTLGRPQSIKRKDSKKKFWYFNGYKR